MSARGSVLMFFDTTLMTVVVSSFVVSSLCSAALLLGLSKNDDYLKIISFSILSFVAEYLRSRLRVP